MYYELIFGWRYQKETMCEYSASNYGGNVTTWAYATRTNDEEAIKVVVAKYGNHFYYQIAELKFAPNRNNNKIDWKIIPSYLFLGPVAVSVDANNWDFYRY